MTTFETTLRQGLATLGEETFSTVTPPPISTIKHRARLERPRRRRMNKGAAIALAGLVATSGAVAASGVLPEPVESTLREFRSWGYRADHGAERMAWTTYGDMTYELWRAPLDGNGLCTYVRATGPEGDIDHGGPSGCDPSVFPRRSDEFGVLFYSDRVAHPSATGGNGARAGLAASGQLPVDAAAVVFDFADGTSLTVAPQRDRYFITVFPGVPDGTRIVALRAVDDEGRTVGREHSTG